MIFYKQWKEVKFWKRNLEFNFWYHQSPSLQDLLFKNKLITITFFVYLLGFKFK